MKWVLILLAVLVGLTALLALLGALLPKGHVASRAARFRQPPAAVWAAITDYKRFPSWRTDIREAEALPDRQGWREVRKDGWGMPLEVTESVPERRLVTRIADPKMPFGGTWTYELSAVGAGTELRITENGEVYNPIFRALSRLFDMTATIKGYLKALGKKFEEEVSIVK